MALAETPNLKLPLDVHGHVAAQQAITEGFEKLDAAYGDLLDQTGGGGPAPIWQASQIGITPIEGYEATNLQEFLEEVAARVAALENA